MKASMIAILLALLPFSALFAQGEGGNATKNDDGEIRTLFKKSDHPTKVGYYIGPEAAYTQFKDRSVFLVGLSGGAIINHFFSAGLGAYGIVNSRNLWYNNVQDTVGAYLYGGYGGAKFEFRLWPDAPVHVNFPLLVGGGGLVYNTWSYQRHNTSYDGYTVDWDAFFVVEPGVMVELNLLHFMRLDAGVSYRYTPDLDLVNTSSGLINNFNANLSLKFGKF